MFVCMISDSLLVLKPRPIGPMHEEDILGGTPRILLPRFRFHD